MKFVDTHCHLDFPDFDNDRPAVLARAREQGITRIVNVGSSLESCRKTQELAKTYRSVYGTVGIHPHDASMVDDAAIEAVRKMALGPKIVAIGEVGLDYYRDRSPRTVQQTAFTRFIAVAAELNLPLVIHSRNAMDDVIASLRRSPQVGRGGVFHCFQGGTAEARTALDLGFFISLSGSLTFRNATKVREVARYVPLEKLLLETDAPFLAPQRIRGKRNEPACVRDVAETLASLKGVSCQEIARVTTDNANRLFQLPPETVQ
jgi:TatD DNase family protein